MNKKNNVVLAIFLMIALIMVQAGWQISYASTAYSTEQTKEYLMLEKERKLVESIKLVNCGVYMNSVDGRSVYTYWFTFGSGKTKYYHEDYHAQSQDEKDTTLYMYKTIYEDTYQDMYENYLQDVAAYEAKYGKIETTTENSISD